MYVKKLILILSTASLLISCGTASKESGVPTIFDTKGEAEKAARDFGCTGAHKMGAKWMPCKEHGIHGHGSHK
ncbi:DUF3721 domain-containing protein [Prochlorococcus sp. MIT 1223]|uniref:DUF3721 domain-containing protein n=1 Tax=Prochlorococcus sp. MIT 1223 TaxID=3096217 RepID=UPI002A750C59|nr:DUF3721 domain-containing protein [Prochlorococcus sp. MIT 1223]